MLCCSARSVSVFAQVGLAHALVAGDLGRPEATLAVSPARIISAGCCPKRDGGREEAASPKSASVDTAVSTAPAFTATEIVAELKTVPNVLTAYAIDQHKIPNIESLLSDLELHEISLKRSSKAKPKDPGNL